MNTLLMAARQPLFIVVLVVAALTGLLIYPWMFPLGLLVYILAVTIASRDTDLVLKVTQRERMAELREKRKGLTSQTFLAKIEQIERAQEEVERSLRRTGGAVAARLSQSVEPQSRALVEQAYTLARKGQDIERYLSQINPHQLQTQINQLDIRIEHTSDDYTREQLESTRKALVEQLNSAGALQTYIGRITSQLDNIDANLDAMPAQFMRMRASDVDSSTASSQVAQHLSDLNADMTAFVNVLDSALDRAGPV
jgi:uncharacterized protein YukE